LTYIAIDLYSKAAKGTLAPLTGGRGARHAGYCTCCFDMTEVIAFGVCQGSIESWRISLLGDSLLESCKIFLLQDSLFTRFPPFAKNNLLSEKIKLPLLYSRGKRKSVPIKIWKSTEKHT
jgi:hypothetical protein